MQKLMCRYENFFKHADRDSSAVLDFNPEATELFMLDAVLTYESLTGEVAPILSTFKAWMFVHNPGLIKEQDRQKLDAKFDNTVINFRSVPKAQFFKQYQLVIRELYPSLD